MSQRVEKRPVMAALLSFVQPGLGHVYLREWLRAGLWLLIWFGSLAVVLATAGLDLSTTDVAAAAFGLFAAMEDFPIEATLSMFAVTMFATLDAYWLTARNNHRLRRDVGRCPHCGKELDPTLDFCHWCTTTLEENGQNA